MKINHRFYSLLILFLFYSSLFATSITTEEDLKEYIKDGKITLHQGAISNSDALISGSNELSDEVKAVIKDSKLPHLEYKEGDELIPAYMDFYKSLTTEVEY